MERDEIIKRIDILIRGLSQPSTKINGSSEIGIVRAEVEEEVRMNYFPSNGVSDSNCP